MKMLNIKLNLSNLISVVRFEDGKTGPVECVIIPIEANHLFRGNSGIYLDMTAFELKEPKDNQQRIAAFETIEQGAKAHGIKTDKLLKELNNSIKNAKSNNK